MLILLTGGRQIGKTRFLESLLKKTDLCGIRCVGVLTPGTWVDDGKGGFFKTGINAMLLPGGEVFRFADRYMPNDKQGSQPCSQPCSEPSAQPSLQLSQPSSQGSQPSVQPSSQSSQSDSAGLGWKIFDEAIDRINSHFDKLCESGLQERDLLIVDELGALELTCAMGFTSAMKLLKDPAIKGATVKPNAIIVVRPELISAAKANFEDTWGELACIDLSKGDPTSEINRLLALM